MVQLIRTDPTNRDFLLLVKHLDAELAEVDGDDYAFYAQFNKTSEIKYAIVAYENEIPVGCGAMKQYELNTLEIKRMYVYPESRGKGIATRILAELEKWATELSVARCILETGIRQPNAIRLYKKNGYQLIPNYGQYAEDENSVCFEKEM
ncbi:MAG: N-acetyltransferase [Saprospiraceae bacterium]|nr:MAG: N-acetyltransferase [Saprospiraceae bacterium]